MTEAFRFRGVVKRFKDFQLGPLDLELEAGTVLGYIGPNGAGKTTTLHCLAGLLKIDAGEIDVFGRRNDPAHPDWKQDIGYVGDAHPFYENWNGQRNLDFLAQFRPGWSHELARDLARRFDLALDKKVKSLSKGNRVKLALVSALAYHPRLLLFDEPTAGLDPVVRAEVLDVLFDAVESGERAIFYSTHILSDISRLADDLAFIDHGNLLFRTAKDDLTDQWRRISFRLSSNDVPLEAVVAHRHEGDDHQVISSDCARTRRQLSELGADNIRENRMSIDEIAVQIMKEGGQAAVSSSRRVRGTQGETHDVEDPQE